MNNRADSGPLTMNDWQALIEVISRYRLGLQNTEPDILGRAYEYLLRKFAEGQGQSAGEFYTPKEVGWLMARLINPEPHTTIYDPACGSGGLLIKPRLLFKETHPEQQGAAPQIYGQELTATTYAMAKMNAFLHDFIGADLQIGDTFRNPGFVADDSELQRFDYVLANPMWNQKEYNEDLLRQRQLGTLHLWRSAEFIRRLGVGTAYTRVPKRDRTCRDCPRYRRGISRIWQQTDKSGARYPQRVCRKRPD